MKKNLHKMMIPCVAAMMSMGMAMMSWAASGGWVEEDGIWRYRGPDGSYVSECWKKSGNSWFWLDEDGEMAVDSLIADDDDYYYVNDAGAMLTNAWKEFPNTDDSEDAADTCWYYFGPNGKAYKAGDSGRTTFKTIARARGGASKYAFDEEGRMLYGWVNESSERLTQADAWKEGVYYLGGPGDGALRANGWERIDVEPEDDDMTEDEEEFFDGYYWFYFKSNGKKIQDTTKKINGKKYLFHEYGNTAFSWFAPTTDPVATGSGLHYSDPWECWQSSGWFKTVPGMNIDPEGYEDGEKFWFYADKGNKLVKSQIKKINGYYYAFNEYGEMLEGLYKMSVNGREIQAYGEIESEDDLPEADEAWEVYYFGGSSKEGAMKTGKVTIDIDGESYTYNFRKSGVNRGAGYDGISDGELYCKGRLMKADKDSRLEVVTYDDSQYLVNTSGKIQKKKTNIKDADDRYYCTDSDGIVIYRGNEKYVDD